MRVLMITARSDIGGGPKHVYDLVRTIKSSSEIKIFIAAPDEEPFGTFFKTMADGFIKIPRRKLCPWTMLKLFSYCKKNKIDIIHSHGRGAGLYSRILGLSGRKVVHTFHGAHFTKNLTGQVKSLLDRLLKNLTDQFICVSSDEKNKVIEFNWATSERVNVILNGIDHIQINKEFSQFKKASSSNVYGTLARFNYQKGLDLFLDTVKKYKDFFIANKVFFKVAGDGEEFEKLNNLRINNGLSDIVDFVGATTKPIEFLATLDVYFSFARWEGLPLSVLEAMSCPLPCLLSDVVGHQEFKESKSCLFFDLKDAESFVNNVLLLNDPELRNRLSKASFETILKIYTLNNMTQKTVTVYKTFVGPGFNK